MDRPAVDPHLFVVLGATGDLMQRKLLPALYRLSGRGELPEGSHILGVARRPMDDAAFQTAAATWLKAGGIEPEKKVRDFCARTLSYHSLEDESPASFDRLRTAIEALEQKRGLPGNRIFYLALPLEAIAPTATGLGGARLGQGPGWTRIVVEKPFGRDLASAQALNAVLHQHFAEPQIYRIDHYLGKETVQNLLVFRFANMFVESLWTRASIERVEITVAESLGVETRAAYYDSSGALRDMIQNHVSQILMLVAMEPPATRSEESIRNEKVKVLRSISPISSADAVRGQYTAGTVGGEEVVGYLHERESPLPRRRRRTSPSVSRSRTGAGRGYRSSCGPGNASPRRRAAWSSRSRRPRWRSSRRRRSTRSTPTASRSSSNPRRGSSSRSRSRSRGASSESRPTG